MPSEIVVVRFMNDEIFVKSTKQHILVGRSKLGKMVGMSLSTLSRLKTETEGQEPSTNILDVSLQIFVVSLRS